jgi:hypothetical protein
MTTVLQWRTLFITVFCRRARARWRRSRRRARLGISPEEDSLSLEFWMDTPSDDCDEEEDEVFAQLSLDM